MMAQVTLWAGPWLYRSGQVGQQGAQLENLPVAFDGGFEGISPAKGRRPRRFITGALVYSRLIHFLRVIWLSCPMPW